MKKLSDRVLGITSSPTVAMDARYKQLLSEGKPVLSLGAGEPDLSPPEEATQAAMQAIRDGKSRYAHMAGLPELRAALSRKFSRENQVEYAPDEILVTSGAKQAVFLALLALLDPGDEVIIPSPYWVTYPEAVRLLGGKPVIVETRMSEDFKLQPEALRRAVTDKTKLLVLNSPCNPTGTVYNRAELEALGKIVVENDLYLLSDEIYEHIAFDDAHGFSPAALGPDLRNRTATVNGFSKAFAMQGWRLGYVGAPTFWAKAMIAAQSHAAHHPSTLSQYAGLGCLAASEQILPATRAHYQELRDFTVERLRQIPHTSFVPPQGAFYVFLSVEKLLPARAGMREIRDSLGLSNYLLEEWNLATVPGIGFGREGFLRLSFANSLSTLKMALDRLEQGLAALSPSR